MTLAQEGVGADTKSLIQAESEFVELGLQVLDTARLFILHCFDSGE